MKDGWHWSARSPVHSTTIYIVLVIGLGGTTQKKPITKEDTDAMNLPCISNTFLLVILLYKYGRPYS